MSNWNADRIAQECGHTYRGRIVCDIADNERDMRARTAYYLQVKRFSERILDDLDGVARVPDEEMLVDAYQATQIYPRPMVRSNYDEATSMGALDTLGDDETRQKIANYYVAITTSEATFGNVPAYRETARRSIPYRVQERIRTNSAEQMTTSATGFVVLSLPDRCELGLSHEEIITRAAARVRAAPGIELDLTRHLADVDQKLIQFDRCEQRARQLGAELSASR